MKFFEPATSRFADWLSNRQPAKSRVGKGRVWLVRVGLGLGRIGVSNADSDLGF